ncbi:MAG TPA: hypothetical protein VG095_02155 [Chthoniobacterales bacterium]|nr:hypothetical protein [Chthoniobacterales bacterium]
MQLRLLVLLLAAFSSAEGVILYRTGDVDANTTAPDIAFPHAGWDYEGAYGFFLGTPIAPQFFISAKHVSGGVGSVLMLRNALTGETASYTVIREYRDPTSDLDIFEIGGTFPYFAPLYDKQDESGKRIVVIGRGTDRGGPIEYNNDPMQLRGWYHGADSHTQRWGENIIAAAFPFLPEWDLLVSDFDKVGLPDECHLSGGDSGGGAFINDGGVWKLAGISYAIDSGFYMQPDLATGFNGAIFDLRGYYYRSGGAFVQIDPNSPNPIPTSFYPTRISTKLPWIYSVIKPAGDYDNDGTPNLLEYAVAINTPGSRAWSAPAVAVPAGHVSLTYRKVTGAPQLQYRFEASYDLVMWMPVTPEETVKSTNENIQTIEAKLATASAAALVLRLLITQQ